MDNTRNKFIVHIAYSPFDGKEYNTVQRGNLLLNIVCFKFRNNRLLYNITDLCKKFVPRRLPPGHMPP